MIDLKSLRIGNKIHANVAYGGEIKTFKRFNDDLTVIFFSDGSIHGIGEFVQDCSGVPLSPSLLERAGFELSNDSFGGYLIELSKGERIRIIYDEKEGWIWPMNGYHHPSVPYFHTLQNLIFSLRGQELELKPIITLPTP